jgi:anaphase-promoting complex subunit 3
LCLQVEISHLAQDALSIDRLSPQAWCVMGNCFSLQKEHETAIKFFQRALQIDPNFTYAYTLCGHEYYANEDFEKSLMLHRNAIAHDKRHYNAWCDPFLALSGARQAPMRYWCKPFSALDAET